MVIVDTKPKNKAFKIMYFNKIQTKKINLHKYNIKRINNINTSIQNFNDKIDIMYNTIKNHNSDSSEMPFILNDKIVQLFKNELDFLLINIPKIIKGKMRLKKYINASLLFLWLFTNNNTVFNNFVNELRYSVFIIYNSKIKQKDILYHELASLLGGIILNHYYVDKIV